MTAKYLNGVDDMMVPPDAVLGGGTDTSAIAEWMCKQVTTVSSRSTPAASRAARSTGAPTTGGSPATSSVPSMGYVPPPTVPDESQLLEHSYYRNRDGQEVHSPAHSITGSFPAGATAQCRDGAFSFSQHRSGTCSGHGGVSQWIN